MSEIPEAAIVAGARALGHLEGEDEWPPVDDTWGQYEENLLAQAKSVLEAALPHLQPTPRTVTSIEELERLPIGTVIIDVFGEAHILYWEDGRQRMGVAGDYITAARGYCRYEPLTVLYVPEESDDE